MKKTLLAAAFALLALADKAQQLTSPDGKMKLYFRIDDGRPTYTLTVDGRNFIAPSHLGYKLKSNNSEQNSFSEVKSTMPKDQNAEQKADCYSGFQLLRYENNSFDETWRPVPGEESSIRNHCNELLVCLKQSKNDRFMNIRFRLFDDGLGCRYEFSDQKKLTYFVVADELTEFAMTGDHTAWWVAGDYDTQEFECRQTKLSGIRGRMQKAIQATSAGTPAGSTTVQTALQMRTADGLYVNAHEATRPTGLCRTYPNLIANESARGTEYEAFGGNPVNHTTIFPFTRCIGGPMDYTPGIFVMDLRQMSPDNKSHVHSTLARQLTLYVTLYSPLQMAADVIEHYEARPDAFQFIKDVAPDWDKSLYLAAEPGEYVLTARKAKGKDEWSVGCTAGDNGYKTNLPLDFLTPGRNYTATLYTDAPVTARNKRPEAYVIKKMTVNHLSSV